MDHMRYNYIAQPGDKVPPAFAGVGEYDKWAIEFGYKLFFDAPGKGEEKILDELVNQRGSDPRLKHIKTASGANFFDPRSRAYDLGNDLVKGCEYGVKNLQWILPKMKGWVGDAGAGKEKLKNLYLKAVDQYLFYLDLVRMIIGGAHTLDAESYSYQPIPKEDQKKVIYFLEHYYFPGPAWLIENELTDLFSQMSGWRDIETRIVQSFNCVSLQLLKKLDYWYSKDEKNYSVQEYLNDIEQAVWSELKTHQSISSFRRKIQAAYVMQLRNSIQEARSNKLLALTVLLENRLADLQTNLAKSLPAFKCPTSIAHLKEQVDSIALQTSKS